MVEDWKHWEPFKSFSKRYYLDSLVSNQDVLMLEILDASQEKKIELKFKAPVYAYRYTDESVYFGTFADLSKKYGGEFYAEWSFFKIYNSEYVKLISEESGIALNNLFLTHFCIKCFDEVIDVLAQYEPEVKIMK